MSELYKGIEFSPVAKTTSVFVPALTTITITDISVLPVDVPNLICLAIVNESEGTLESQAVLRYTGVSGNTLTGISILATINPVDQYPIGSVVRRAFTAYEWNALVDAVKATENQVAGIEGDISGIVSKLDDIEDGAQVNIIESVSLNGSPIDAVDKNIDVEIGPETIGAEPAFDVLPISKGGTGAATAEDARDELELGTVAVLNVPATGDAAAGEVVKGNDTRLSDVREPTTHAETHAANGDDPITPESINAAPVSALETKADLVNGKVPESQLPSYVSSVQEYDTRDDFPEEGESNVIYVALDTNMTYRWGGTEYVEISNSLTLGETADSAYRGDRGKVAYDHSQITAGNPHGTTKTDIGLEDVANLAPADLPISDATQAALDTKAGLDVATITADGLMSSADKTKLNDVASGAQVNIIESVSINGTPISLAGKVANIIVDDELNDESTNPVQNDIVTEALAGKASTDVVTTTTDGLMSSADKTKLNGIETGAQVNTPVDISLSPTSTNPVQNKVVTGALGEKVDDTNPLIVYGVPRNSSKLYSGADVEGEYLLFESRRPDGTLQYSSSLSSDYLTRTERYYAANGTTVNQTLVFSVVYNDDGEVIGETLQVAP